ncbi:ACT domain-containing protein [Legionella brunensis]|uniref:Acetolactate synthase 3 regulatory subunit n=1 Tax=Legionella brunensis TaxID=29422 RepID=A0A0W0S2W2_9GAMM|nr:ACT domain-containing protein [Legionella brunensis]KTC77887.1 acetolactate synthase 3 regulatory subunit [Legionella brunensis]
MKYIYALSIVTENTIRVLQRMASIFARNRLNIEQLTVFETGNKGVSLCNVVIHSDIETMERAIKQLRRIVELLEVNVNSQIPLIGSEVMHNQNPGKESPGS